MVPATSVDVQMNLISEAKALELIGDAQEEYATFVEMSGLNVLDNLDVAETLVPTSYMPLEFIVWT